MNWRKENGEWRMEKGKWKKETKTKTTTTKTKHSLLPHYHCQFPPIHTRPRAGVIPRDPKSWARLFCLARMQCTLSLVSSIYVPLRLSCTDCCICIWQVSSSLARIPIYIDSLTIALSRLLFALITRLIPRTYSLFNNNNNLS